MYFCRNVGKLQTIAGSHYLLHNFLEIREKKTKKKIREKMCKGSSILDEKVHQFIHFGDELVFMSNFMQKRGRTVSAQRASFVRAGAECTAATAG